MSQPEPEGDDIVVALDHPAAVFRALRLGSTMLALLGFAAVVLVFGQATHVPLRSGQFAAIAILAVVALLVIAPLSWFAINAIRPVFLLPFAGLALWPAVSYYQYVVRVGGTFGPDLLYGALIPNIPVGFVLWAGLRGMRLSPSERLMARVFETGGYFGILRAMFGVWPGLIRSPLQTAISSILIYLGQVLHGLAVTLVGAIVLLLPGEIRFIVRDSGTLIVSLIVLALIAVLMLAGAGLRNLGRMVSRQSLENRIARDRRPPILFLRAFNDDQVTLPRASMLHCFLRGEFGRRRLDHVLVEEFSRYGPIVALGVPGQRGLPFGAARVYVQHDQWQAKVLELAQRSAHIVLVADQTAGVEWEIDTMLAPPLRAKTLFLATPRLGDLRASTRLGAVLEENQVGRLIGAFQTGNGRSVILTLLRPSPEAYIVALQAFFRRDRLAEAIS